MEHETTSSDAGMFEFSYQDRAHPFARARIFHLGETSLLVREGGRERRIDYSDIKAIESFTIRFVGSSTDYLRRIVHLVQGDSIVLTAAYRNRFRLVDRSDAFRAFIDELQRRIDVAN